jgi:hypothetical protein
MNRVSPRIDRTKQSRKPSDFRQIRRCPRLLPSVAESYSFR